MDNSKLPKMDSRKIVESYNRKQKAKGKVKGGVSKVMDNVKKRRKRIEEALKN